MRLSPKLYDIFSLENRTVLIVGLGYSGERFFRVFKYFQRFSDKKLKVIVCDPFVKDSSLRHEMTFYSDLEKALRIEQPEVVVVCANEFAHFEILRTLIKYPEITILCEKPLTETIAQTEQLSILRNRKLSINLVERFSPICQAFIEWKQSFPEFKVTRVEGFWGKCRVSDSRPTIGVLSEIIHPIDLIDYLVGLDCPTITQIFGIASDYSIHSPKKILDSVDVVFSTVDFPVVIRS